MSDPVCSSASKKDPGRLLSNVQKAIPIILSIIAVYNTALVCVCLAASATVQYDYYGFYNTRYTFMGKGERYAIIFFYFCTIIPISG